MKNQLKIILLRRTERAVKVLSIIFLLFCISIKAQIFKDKRVLLLNSYHPQYACNQNFTKTISDELNKYLEEEGLYIEYLKNQSQKGATFQIIFNKNNTL